MIIKEIRTRRDLVDLVNEIGFLPFFSGRIEGFSLEENVSYEAWYQGRWSGRVKPEDGIYGCMAGLADCGYKL